MMDAHQSVRTTLSPYALAMKPMPAASPLPAPSPATSPAPPHYPLADHRPAPGQLTQVAPGVFWLRMALPFALDHINLWLLEDVAPSGAPGWAIVDCGIANEATRATWELLFAQGLAGRPVLRVLVTHMHPDHIGLAGWLCERWSTPQHACRLWISATDWLCARLARLERSGYGGEHTAEFFAQHGVADAVLLDELRHKPNAYTQMVGEVPHRFCRLSDGLRLRIGAQTWECIAGYGHAPEHMALYCAELGVLISGDMVLPRISTNVSVTDFEPEANPLRWYLDSLETLGQRVPAQVLVLPSHGLPFTGLHARIAAQQSHHAQRLAEVLTACAQAPHSAADLLPLLFQRPLDRYQMRFALGEAVAHVNALWLAGQLQAALGEDGVLRFTAPSP